jgi:WD40 repeat protein
MDVQDDKVIAGFDRKITVSSLSNFGKIFEKKPEKIKTTGSQDFVKVLLDRSGTFLISASSDKYFTIQDMLSNTLVTKGTVGEQITSIQLTLDNRYLITTSARGLIYFWKLNDQITKAMTQRLKEQDIQLPSLANPYIPDLTMPPVMLKKQQSLKPVTAVKKQTSDEWTEDPNQKLFGGKSPAEILFNKNRLK